MIDVMYILGTGSKWKNNEIRYSLRSLEKHLKEYRNIYIVGERPDFLDYSIIKHIPAREKPVEKQRRIGEKILAGIKGIPDLSANFLFFNDDHFLLDDFKAFRFPYYYKYDLKQSYIVRKQNDPYYHSLKNTHDILSKNNLSTKNFDIHCPIMYNKYFFKAMMDDAKWPNDFGFVLKSLYCNTLSVIGEEMMDCKLYIPMDVGQIKKMIHRKKFFSIGDKAINKYLEEVLEELYPKKSKFEL